MKRFALIFLLGGMAVSQVRGDDRHAVEELFKQAQEAMAGKKFDDAIQLNEKVFTEHPEAVDRWFTAQMNITSALCKKGDFEAAAKSAHLALDGAQAANYDSVVNLTAGILSAQDKNLTRANAFIAFEQSGSANGQLNPLDDVGYPAMPARETAFATFRQQAGDDSMASRLRGQTYLFSGRPKEALAQFADAVRRSDNGNSSLPQRISDLINLGLRNVLGNRVGLDSALQFTLWGPNGPDGKAGTPDDVADPFGALLPPIPDPGAGGLAGLSAADLATLRQVRDAAQLYGGDSMLGSEVRPGALDALQHLTSALDGWGSPGQEDWYLSRALHPSGTTSNEEARRWLLIGAELAARGRAMHLAEVRKLWEKIDAETAADGLLGNKTLEEVRAQFDKLTTEIGQLKFPPIAFKPLTAARDPSTF